MFIKTYIDTSQEDTDDRSSMAVCPVCGQKLMAVRSIFYRSVFRLKCRRCRKYIRIEAFEENTQHG